MGLLRGTSVDDSLASDSLVSWLLPEWLIFRHALRARNSCVTYRGLSAHGLCLDRVLSYLITDTVARLDNDVAHHAPFLRAITRP